MESALRESNQKNGGNKENSGSKKTPSASKISETKVTVEPRHHLLCFDINISPQKFLISFPGAVAHSPNFFLGKPQQFSKGLATDGTRLTQMIKSDGLHLKSTDSRD